MGMSVLLEPFININKTGAGERERERGTQTDIVTLWHTVIYFSICDTQFER